MSKVDRNKDLNQVDIKDSVLKTKVKDKELFEKQLHFHQNKYNALCNNKVGDPKLQNVYR